MIDNPGPQAHVLPLLSTFYPCRIATKMDVEAIVQVTNEAFLADAFFKKPEYRERFTQDQIADMLSKEGSAFLVVDDESGGLLAGSIFIEWGLEDADASLVGHFSAVSVRKALEKRGLGRLLVQAAESFLIEKATQGQSVRIEMGVINLREDLFPWYQKQGYVIGDRIEDTPEIARIILPDMQVHLVRMSKQL